MRPHASPSQIEAALRRSLSVLCNSHAMPAPALLLLGHAVHPMPLPVCALCLHAFLLRSHSIRIIASAIHIISKPLPCLSFRLVALPPLIHATLCPCQAFRRYYALLCHRRTQLPMSLPSLRLSRPRRCHALHRTAAPCHRVARRFCPSPSPPSLFVSLRLRSTLRLCDSALGFVALFLRLSGPYMSLPWLIRLVPFSASAMQIPPALCHFSSTRPVASPCLHCSYQVIAFPPPCHLLFAIPRHGTSTLCNASASHRLSLLFLSSVSPFSAPPQRLLARRRSSVAHQSSPMPSRCTPDHCYPLPLLCLSLQCHRSADDRCPVPLQSNLTGAIPLLIMSALFRRVRRPDPRPPPESHT